VEVGVAPALQEITLVEVALEVTAPLSLANLLEVGLQRKLLLFLALLQSIK
jgi:hypothetical protein